jgi:hypothetical protein
MDMVRSMLAGKNVPKEFWPEAVKWAGYVMNRSPTLSVKNVTPEEAWSGVELSHQCIILEYLDVLLMHMCQII